MNKTHKNKAQPNPSDPRALALNALTLIWRGESLLSPSLFDAEPSESARALRLTRETLRYEDVLLKNLKRHVNKNPKLPVRALLALASYEFYVEDEEDYAIVNSYVDLAKSTADTKNAASFVNAILRKLVEGKVKLSENNSFGPELHAHLRKQYEKKHILDMSRAQTTRSHLDLRLKSGDVADWAERLDGIALAEHNVVRLPARERVTELEGYGGGEWWVQDAAATLAADCFGDLKGKRVLDLCAAPGGKAMQLCAKGADVTAVEISEKRAARIHENLERTELNAKVVIQDALEFTDEPFDAILLDAPCSATGTLSRHPDLKHDQPLERMRSLAPLQAELLAHAYSLLNQGGELIYVTCSLLKEEGEMQIEQFISQTPSAKIVPLSHESFNLPHDFAPYIRSFPTAKEGQISMDGFFIAKLTKE